MCYSIIDRDGVVSSGTQSRLKKKEISEACWSRNISEPAIGGEGLVKEDSGL